MDSEFEPLTELMKEVLGDKGANMSCTMFGKMQIFVQTLTGKAITPNAIQQHGIKLFLRAARA